MPLPKLQGRTGLGRQDSNECISHTQSWVNSAASPFNTPPTRVDSVESLSDLLNAPVASIVGDSQAQYSQPQHYQVRGCMDRSLSGRQNPDLMQWIHQNTSPFDNTPPPQGDSMEITDLLCLNLPRGSLLGNSNPLAAPNYSRVYDYDFNTSYQSQSSGVSNVRYTSGGYPNPARYEPPSMSTPRKRAHTLDMTPTSPLHPMSPIRPPLSSPPNYSTSNRSTPEEVSSNSQTNSPTDSATSNSSSDPSNNDNLMLQLANQNSVGVFCPPTEQELVNLQNLYAIRNARPTETELMMKLIEQTSRILLAASECKGDEPNGYYHHSPVERNGRLNRSFAMLPSSRDPTSTRPPPCIWDGDLPPRNHKNPTYSCKIFLGGIPWDTSEATLVHAFSKFGQIKVEWPGKDQAANQPKGYAYIIFESEKRVKQLLEYCTHDNEKGGNLFYKISSRKMKAKGAQVIPWALSDSNFARASQKLDPQKTVFVGALHGMINAEALSKIMNDLFGGVIYAGLDTDKYKYPIGSGRVTFSNSMSYMKAVGAAFINIQTKKFTKRVQVDPYLEDSPCSSCSIQQGPYFCREMSCFRYFCRTCWDWQHSKPEMQFHKQLTRTKNTNVSSV